MNTETRSVDGRKPGELHRYAADDFVVVEIKSYSPATGLEQRSYLEIERIGGDDLIGVYEVRQHQRSGANRSEARSFVLRGHRRSLGETELVRCVLNEAKSQQARAA